MTTTYDGIILGAGHNGMILQAYLGKAGLKTVAIERRPVAGGGLSTLEDPRHPGFLHNTHAFFQRAITAMPWYADLALERHGAALHRARAQCRAAHPRRPRARMVDRYRQDHRVVRELQCPRCRDAATLARRVRADRAGHSRARGPRAAAAAGRAARPPHANERGTTAARGQRALAAAVRRAGVRASHHQGRASVLQRPARGRPAAPRLRPPHRRAAGKPGQGADVARRLGGAGARARGGGARERRRDQADDRAQAHPGGGRPRGRH